MNAFKCHRARVNFELYLDGALSPEECEVLEQHLFECSACASAIGDDIQLGEAVGAVAAPGPVPIAATPEKRSWPRLRAAAAAVVLMVGGAAIGHLATREAKPTEDGARDVVAGGPTGDLVPLTELVDGPDVGFASFTDSEVFEAEREGLRSRVGQSEFRARRVEAELELVRPLIEETATPARVIERLQDRVRKMPANPPPRSPRDDRDRMRGGGPFHHVHVAMSLLRRNPQAAFEPAVAWLKTATTPFERQCAVRLLAALRIPDAHDVLVAETRDGSARDVALDGLVVLRDPRSLNLFASLLEDEKESKSTRIKAAGGLHRLGDPRGLEFLLKTFRAQPDQALRRKILFHVGANPGPQAAGALRELLDGVVLESKAERAALAEWLNLSGMSDDDPTLQKLVETAPVESEVRARPGSSGR